MFSCHVCQSNQSHLELVNEIFQVEGKFYLVENIPAIVCDRCGEETFSRETTEGIREMLHGNLKSSKSISVDVFSYPNS